MRDNFEDKIPTPVFVTDPDNGHDEWFLDCTARTSPPLPDDSMLDETHHGTSVADLVIGEEYGAAKNALSRACPGLPEKLQRNNARLELHL